LLLLVAGMFATGVARAQLSGKGELKGTIKDPSGAVVPSATVTAVQDATGQTISRTTNSSGLYDISPLDPGVYTVTVEAQGFRKQTQNDVHVNALEIADYSPELTVGSSSENVTVTSAPPQLETSNATLGATMEQDMYSALPIEMGAYGSPDQRRATDFAFLMPGVQGNNTNGNPTTNTGVVNGSGSRGAVSAVYIDGLPFVRAGGNGDPRFVWTAISVDAVDQFQVQTSGYSAIYEGQGVQNYTIKAGGKDFHGAVYEFLRNTSLDTWGFFGKLPNPVTGKPQKPVEHSNEYGINLGGPLVPFGSLREKLFFFGNYNGFRYSSETPTQITFPTPAQQAGNFQNVLPLPTGVTPAANLTNAIGVGIFDPNTQTQCTANNRNSSGGAGGPCRYRYGYIFGGTPGLNGGATIGPGGTAAVDVIPASQFSAVALKMQSFLPSGISNAVQNNYLSPNRTGLTNWSTTERIDFNMSQKDTFSAIAAIGRQASSVPVGQTTAGRNVGPVPYNYGQAYAPKTAVGIVEETHTFTPNIVNQIKYGYARYNGPTFDADQLPQYAATAMGISGLPPGPAQQAFPIVTFAGTNAPTGWAGAAPNVTLAENYTLLDNLQWVKGNHTLTIGGQVAWMQYNVINATGGTTPLTLAYAVTETARLNNAFTAVSGTGLSYASYLIGQVDRASFTQYLQQEFGARFRPISPYIQDNWKVNSKLTLDLGLRYDFYPSVTEVHDAMSYFDPNVTNPVTGLKGGLVFTGHGANTCNCRTPVNNYKKNFGPRIGFAFQSDPKTVWRGSWGVMFTHGGAVGGSNTSLGTLGFSGGLSASANGSLLSTAPLTGNNGALPGYATPTGAASGPAFGTGFTTTSGYTGTPQSMGYADPYLGGRAPEYINWSFGFQHQWTNALTSSISYVGSEGHFLPADSATARGYWSNQLDPKYLYLQGKLSDQGAAAAADCSANGLTCYSNFATGQSLATELKPFPFQSVTDSFSYVSNSNYHALQTTFNLRASHGLTFMANYTWSKAIDNGGTFRTGYAIPAGLIANAPNLSYPADRIERSLSTSSQPHHVVVTAVWNLPFGREVFSSHAWQRAIFGGFLLSEAFQAFSGSPLAITCASSQTNPGQSTCVPALNPAFSGDAHTNGKWGQGYVAGMSTATAPSYINSNAFALPPNYQFGNAPRTGAYNLYGPGNYDLDMALVRSFPLKFTESAKLNFRVEMYNVTNHTKFAVASTAWGNATFGQVTSDPTATRKAVQLSGRIQF
jgi:hypothetical protein